MGNKKLFKKRFFHWTINAHLSPVFCTHHIYYDLTLHHFLAWSELFLQGMYKTRHLSSTATAKGWKKHNPSATTTGCFNYRFLLCYSTYPCSCSIWNCRRTEMWDEELTWEFLFPYPTHYLQQSKGFIVLFLSLLFNTACSTRNFKRKEGIWRNRDFILGLPRSIEQFVLKNRLLLSLNYHMQ